MDGDQLIIQDLGLDALHYMERAFKAMDQEVQARVMASVEMGGSLEIRVRTASTRALRISLVLIGEHGELELHTLGGGPAK